MNVGYVVWLLFIYFDVEFDVKYFFFNLFVYIFFINVYIDIFSKFLEKIVIE